MIKHARLATECAREQRYLAYKRGIWPILGLKLAIMATFLKISTSNLAEMGSKLFGGLNQKSESICFSGI